MALRKLAWWDRYRVALDEPDLRGWQLVDPEGEDAGPIEDLIFDTDSREVRYVGARIAGVPMLVPLTMVELDPVNRRALMRFSPAAVLQGLAVPAELPHPHLEVERKAVPGWLPWAMLAFLAAGILVAWAVWSVRHAPPLGAGIPPAYQDLALAYQGHVWVPTKLEVPARFTDGDMVKVGRAGGHDLYANRAHGLGWGVARAPQGLETGPWGRVYVRLDDGRYLALRWRTP
jgi:hypothetical protein